MIVNPVITRKGGEGCVFEQISPSNISETNYLNTITTSRNIKQLAGLTLLFGPEEGPQYDSVYMFVYPDYNGNESKLLEMRNTRTTGFEKNMSLVDFTVSGNSLSFYASVPIHLVGNFDQVRGVISYIPE